MSLLKHFYVLLAFSMVSLLSFSSCSNDDDEETPNTPAEVIEPIGQYVLNGDSVDILSGYWMQDDQYYLVKFSPIQCDYLDATSYIIIALHKELMGQEMIIDHMFQNDDYIFVYETPAHFYSQYKKLMGGTMYFELVSGFDEFKIKMDTKLYDGTPFSIDFQGKLQEAEVN